MMDLVNFKNSLDELCDQLIDINREMEYRRIELTGCNDSAYELCRRSDKDEELLSRDIIYNYLKVKLEEIKRNKSFIEIYGTSVYDAARQYKEWCKMANIKKEDDE